MITSYDVFNGDADGIVSLIQLRLTEPRPDAVLVTGRKRDIKLLAQIKPQSGDDLTVLDISMRSNGDDLRRILNCGAHVFYVDHHNPGEIPEHLNLKAVIDTSSENCTAMLVDSCLEGAYRAWAVTAAFGDNFPALAKRKAAGLNLPLDKLQRLGILINYNGYGAEINDLFFHPADLYRALLPYADPQDFLADKTDVFHTLEDGYTSDMDKAKQAKILDESVVGQILVLPNTASSRRVSGVYGNAQAQAYPARAHAILTEDQIGQNYLVSIRAPLSRRTGADRLALQFETGGGRSAAAGINVLPAGDLPRFIDAFRAAFS